MSIILKPVADQVVVITGASSGMGRSAALQFARQGARVVVAARSEVGLQSLVGEIQAGGGRAAYQVTDVGELTQVEALAEFAVTIYGRIDTWVGAAGIWATAKFTDTRPDEFERIIRVNLLGQANSLWAALPHLKANVERSEAAGGAVILFASVLGQLGLPLTSAYVASKHGVMGLADAVRVELMQEGWPISVTTILPFGTNTPIYNTGLTRIGYMPRPAAPVVQPEVVAEAVVYAAGHPIRQVYGSGASKVFALANQLMPEVVDAVLTQMSTAQHQSSNVKRGGDFPNNVHDIVADFRVRGDFSDESLDYSPYVARQMGQTDDRSDVQATLDVLAQSPALVNSSYDFALIRSWIERLIEQQRGLPVNTQ